MRQFFEIDPQRDLLEAVARFEAEAGEVLLPGDERYQFLAQMVQAVCALKAQVNLTANQNLL